MVMAVAEIVSELVKAVRENRDVDLNKYVLDFSYAFVHVPTP